MNNPSIGPRTYLVAMVLQSLVTVPGPSVSTVEWYEILSQTAIDLADMVLNKMARQREPKGKQAR